MKVQIAVLEVGLGGLYDSTNVVPAKVAGITPISLEHTDKLGKTVSKIAVQKCGVIKGRETVVSSAQTTEAQSVMEAACRDREALLVRVGKEIRILERDFSEDFQRFDVRTPWGNFYDLETRLRGKHQLDNAAQAIGLAKALEKKTRIPVSDEAVKQGVLDARWPGRLEKIADRPRVVLDGAHNVDSVRKMMEGLKRHFRFSDLIVVFGSSADKDVAGMLTEILAECHCLVLTQSAHPRALGASKIESLADPAGKEIFIEATPKEALAKARSLADPDDLVVVTGSLYLVGETRQELFSGG